MEFIQTVIGILILVLSSSGGAIFTIVTLLLPIVSCRLVTSSNRFVRIISLAMIIIGIIVAAVPIVGGYLDIDKTPYLMNISNLTFSLLFLLISYVGMFFSKSKKITKALLGLILGIFGWIFYLTFLILPITPEM